MRSDIAKVICEDARRGSRDDSKMTARFNAAFKPSRDSDDRHEDYANLDCLPRTEGMKKRINVYYGGGKEFSENLGALRGLIIKNVGKNWDKIYSALCDLVKPNGINVHRHVHQHLSDFIHLETKMVDGQVCCHGSDFKFPRSILDWIPLKKYANMHIYGSKRMGGYFYFVHPETRCITRIKRDKEVERPVAETKFIRREDEIFLKLNGVWWQLELAANFQRRHKKCISTSGTIIFITEMRWALSHIEVKIGDKRVCIFEYIRDIVDWRKEKWSETKLFNPKDREPKGNVIIGKRQLGSKELKKLGVVNDSAKEPVWKKTKAGWKNIA